MMGRGLERLGEVPAGCCLAIGGLERAILKSATLSSTPAARPLAPMLFQVLHFCRDKEDSLSCGPYTCRQHLSQE